MHEYRDRHAISDTWATTDRVLVCVGPDPLSARLVRARQPHGRSRCMRSGLAVYVETPSLARLPQPARDAILRTLKLAEQLGAETANLSGETVAGALLDFARQRNVSRIVVGKPTRSGWRARKHSLVDELIDRSGNIDIYVITGEGGRGKARCRRERRSATAAGRRT